MLNIQYVVTKRLLRNSGRTLPIGTVSSCYRSRLNNLQAGDVLEIVDETDTVLNIAIVTEATEDKIFYRMTA